MLEGYVYLGELGSLGEEVLAAFVSAMSSAAVKVVRGIIVGRAGLEEHARATAIFGELVKLLPADLFRPCLAQVRACAIAFLQNIGNGEFETTHLPGSFFISAQPKCDSTSIAARCRNLCQPSESRSSQWMAADVRVSCSIWQ